MDTPCSSQTTSKNVDHVNIQLDSRNYAKGSLPDGKSVLLLFDSGATRTLISQQFVSSSKYLSSITPESIPTVHFRLGNGAFLAAKKKITFKVSIQNQTFDISAFVASNLTGIDFIIGNDTLRDLKGKLDFESNIIRLQKSKFYLRPVRRTILHPGESKCVLLQVKGRIPTPFQNSEIPLHAIGMCNYVCPSVSLVKFRNGRTRLLFTNPSNRLLTFTPRISVAYFDTDEIVTVLQESSFDHLAFSEPMSHERPKVRRNNLLRYPHLDCNDPNVDLTEREVIRKCIHLHDSVLSSEEKNTFYNDLDNHRQAFSLYGEISSCPNFEVDIQLTNTEPFFIRPYVTSDSDKQTVDKELGKLVKLGILGIGHKSYTSPVFLVGKKDSKEKRVVTDFRHLNNRIKRLNHPFPLLNETLRTIGYSNAKVLSVLDLKSAFFCHHITVDNITIINVYLKDLTYPPHYFKQKWMKF